MVGWNSHARTYTYSYCGKLCHARFIESWTHYSKRQKHEIHKTWQKRTIDFNHRLWCLGEKHKTTPGNPDYSKKHLIFAAEQSIRRLGVDALDILQLHSPDSSILEKDEPWEAMETLKQQGKIKHAGWSVQSFMETEQAHFLEEHHDLLDVIQVRYNLLEREAEKKLFPMAVKYGTGVIVRIPILFGFLTGKFSRHSKFGEDDHRRFNLSPEKLEKYLAQLENFKPFFNKHDQFSMAQLSLRFCISHPACHTAIPGGKTPQQVIENVAASDIEIKYEDFPRLRPD
ncbi:MAG: hypothetical protein PWR04_720 [Anaerophaga sp.]|nr:hypothetical protein [Anaerophaga sp.]